MKSIDITSVTKNYKNHVVHHEFIKVSKRVTIIKGQNGSGKSTLCKAIMALIKYTGQIKCSGSIAYFPEYLQLPLILKSKTFLELMIPITRHNIMKQLIHMFKMDQNLDKEIIELSKGMNCKLRLIYTLSLDKDIYLLDEPFSGLDIETTKTLKNYILQSNKMYIISTHLDVFTQSSSLEVINL